MRVVTGRLKEEIAGRFGHLGYLVWLLGVVTLFVRLDDNSGAEDGERASFEER